MRQNAAEPPWTSKPTPAARPDWLSALDGMWPAVEAKVAKSIELRQPSATPDEVRAATLDSVRAIMMIRAYRIRGHLQANLDPLGIEPKRNNAELDRTNTHFFICNRENAQTCASNKKNSVCKPYKSSSSS